MCAMTAEQRAPLPSPRFENGQALRPRPRKRGGAGKWIAAAIVLAVIGGGGATAYSLYSASRVEDEARDALTKPVVKGPLVISVVEDGNMESASNIELKCEVEGGAGGGGGQGSSTTILSIIPDGTEVKKGDELVKLDSSAIE